MPSCFWILPVFPTNIAELRHDQSAEQPSCSTGHNPSGQSGCSTEHCRLLNKSYPLPCPRRQTIPSRFLIACSNPVTEEGNGGSDNVNIPTPALLPSPFSLLPSPFSLLPSPFSLRLIVELNASFQKTIPLFGELIA